MRTTRQIALAVGALALAAWAAAQAPESPATARLKRVLTTEEQAAATSVGCLSCHAGIEPMHPTDTVEIGCAECHGGDATAMRPAEASPESELYRKIQRQAHVQPSFPERWPSSANPERSYTLTLQESRDFIRFVNPGDLRVAEETCGPCHQEQVNRVMKSPMTTSSIFWAAAAYANGVVGQKAAFLGESYSPDGKASRIQPSVLFPEDLARGGLAFLLPLPRWETTQPGEYFRAFERGGILQPSFFPDIGNPNALEDAGRPDIRLSNRGPGTGLRISPALINLHKTRLNDPHLSFLGTNDHPGDFRSSGCSGCHVVYANDRDPLHSGPWAAFGHQGKGQTADSTIPKDEPGHPVRHSFTRAIPTSQCMSCHMHQPNSFVNTYLGYTMWDYETDGEALWPKEQRDPSAAEVRASLDHNPEGAAVRGLWTERAVLDKISELNPTLKHTRFADYHGHGWVFRAVFKQDRKGNLLDSEGKIVPFDDPARFDKAVHLKDIHLEKGMHCVDCHFSQDSHGDGLLHGEYGNALEIGCEDCHGTVRAYTTLKSSGPAAPKGGTDLALGTTPSGRRRFAWWEGKLYQRSMVDPKIEWEVVQVKDTVTPGNPRYNETSRLAKTLQKDGVTWGVETASDAVLAHADSQLTCYSCHSAWATSCSGCHLPQEANVKSEVHHYEGGASRNYASYNPQVIRTDAYMLGINGKVKGGKIAPVRSSSALVLSSTNANRQRFYIQQPPISAPGFSSQAFNPHVPHTVRSRETKTCTDCHVSAAGDNNAWMAQLLTQGTNFVNFVGRFAWVAEGTKGLEAVAVTEWDEPQAVIGSTLHKLAYPRNHAEHAARGGELEVAHHHHGGGAVQSVQLRGEYLFTAKGQGGFEVFDVANVDNKDFSERIVTAPVSPLGQRTYVRTRDATAVALPTTMPVARRVGDPKNLEQPLAPIYDYAFVSDREEGLVVVDVSTLTDGNPANNLFSRALTWNPNGVLTGAESLTVAGNWIYVVTKDRLVVIDAADPLAPRLAAQLDGFDAPAAVAVQFRYAFVADRRGLAVVEVTDPASPLLAARVEGFSGRSVYVARTYAYVAAGERGVAIVDVERPEKPFLDRLWNGDGRLKDSRDVKVASTNASLFAYVADGLGGLYVVQLTSPESVPGYLGFSPRPEPKIVAHRKTHGPALALSKGLDRDRAADESGNQVSIFNRLGSRPFNLGEMQRLFLRGGKLFTVTDAPPGAPKRQEGQR